MSADTREGHIDYVEFPAQSAESFSAVKRFYHDVFGWSFQDWGESIPTRSSGVDCGFSCAPADRPATTLAVLFPADLEASRKRVLKAGGVIAKEIASFPGCRRFEYVDRAGNRLGVWSDK